MKRKRDSSDIDDRRLKYPRFTLPSDRFAPVELSRDKPESEIYIEIEKDDEIFYLGSEKETYFEEIGHFSSGNLLGESIDDILKRVREKKFDEKIEEKIVNKKRRKSLSLNFSQLLVDKYRPESYLDLLTDERINQKVLGWLKQWDPITFPKRSSNRQFSKFGPKHKFLLIAGPPGVGKTTLAHVVARTAGYEPVEINASDDRSKKRLVEIINNVSQKKNVFFHKSTNERERPKIIVMDEVDGAVGSEYSAIHSLVNAVKIENKRRYKKKKKTKKKNVLFGGGSVFGRKKKKKMNMNILKKKKRGRVRRKKTEEIQSLRIPIILICNNPFESFLRELRLNSEFIQFPRQFQKSQSSNPFTKKNTNRKIVDRLVEICSNEKMEFSRPLLSEITHAFGNDIRSCLNYLQFYQINQFYFGHLKEKKDDSEEEEEEEEDSGIKLEDEVAQLKRAFKDVKKFKRDVVENIFETRGRGENMRDFFNDLASEMGNTKILDSAFQNYPHMRYTDIDFAKTCEILEYMSLGDQIQLVLRKTMQFQLSYFMIMTLICVKLMCQTPFKEHVMLKSENYEIFQKTQSSKGTLNTFKAGMRPEVYRSYSKKKIVLDLLPVIKTILNPPMIRRNINNIKLFRSDEKKEVYRILGLHNSFGTTYIMKTDFFSRRSYYAMVPSIYQLSKPFSINKEKEKNKTENRNKFAPPLPPSKLFEVSYGVKRFLSRYTGKNKEMRGNMSFLTEEEEKARNLEKEKKSKLKNRGLSIEVKRIKDQYKDLGVSNIMSPMSPIENQFNFNDLQPPTRLYCRFVFQEGSTKAVRTKANISDF